MKHKGLRTTPQEQKLIKSRKSIGEVAKKIYNRKISFYKDKVDLYYVPYELVRTEDLIELMRGLTIFTGFISYLKMPSQNTVERMTYLDLMKGYTGVAFDEEEFNEMKEWVRNKHFVDNQNMFFNKLKKELSTREHVPKGKDKKIIRKLKAQGRYVVD